MDLVMTDDAKTRLDGFTLFDDIALCEIVRYGVYNDENMISDLSRFYREMIMEKEEEQRFELYCPSSKHLGHVILFPMGGSGSSRFDVMPLVVDGSSGVFGWSVS
jgi:hypothetical protein